MMPDDQDGAAAQEGVRCPDCNCAHVPVWSTRRRARHVLRVRICRHCGRRFVTRERSDGPAQRRGGVQ
ncbi:MAG: hypothetical protein HRF50_04450 [Phycisphaerae bacterium]